MCDNPIVLSPINQLKASLDTTQRAAANITDQLQRLGTQNDEIEFKYAALERAYTQLIETLESDHKRQYLNQFSRAAIAEARSALDGDAFDHLQRQIETMHTALQNIANGSQSDPRTIAQSALDELSQSF